MPFNNTQSCTGTCANDVAAQLWALSNAPASTSRGKTLLDSSLCVDCHSDNGNGTTGGTPIDVNNLAVVARESYPDTEKGLADYISANMPIGLSTCTGTCAADLAAYFWQFRN